MAKTDHYPVTTKWNEDRTAHWSVRIATCSVCGEHAEVTDNKPGGLPVAVISEKFRHMGWEVGTRRAKDRCPKHARLGLSGAERKRHDKVTAIIAQERADRSPHPADARTKAKTATRIVEEARKGVLAAADPSREIIQRIRPASSPLIPEELRDKVAALGKAPPPRAKDRPSLTVDHPMFDPPEGTDVFIRRTGRGGAHVRQTGWKPTVNGGSWSNVRKAARVKLGPDAQPDHDFTLFAEPDGTMGWKPVRQPEIQPPAPPEPLGETMTDTTTKPEWTRDQRRSARDALDLHYDEGAQRYKGNWTDKSLGDTVSVPWALIAEVREQFYGPNVNEAAVQHRRELKQAIADAEKLAERHLTLAADAEAFASRCKRLLGE